MKRIFFVLGLIMVNAWLSAQEDYVFMRIGDRDIMRSEFDYIMNKNKASYAEMQNGQIQSPEDVFVNYKLKVIEAENRGMDTTKAFLREFMQYRKQLAAPYLTDDSLNRQLYMEAYNHFKQDCEVSHILIKIKPNASEEERAEALKRAQKARRRLLTEDFGKVADEMSDDPTVKENHGYLGYFAAMQTVWEFEKAMYDAQINSISEPILTAYGYHVIKVHSRRPSYGQVHAAHIFMEDHEGIHQRVREQTEIEIKDVKRRLNLGEDFAALAKEFSEDRGSGSRGGDLGWFGINKMVPEFEKVAFSLKDGEISEPFKTQYGWHIVKVTEHRGAGTFESRRAEIGRAMQYDYRVSAAKKSFVDKKIKELGLTVDSANTMKVINLMNRIHPTDSTFEVESEKLTGDVMRFGENIYSASDFAKFCVAYSMTNLKDTMYGDWMTRFVEFIVTEDENSQLEKKYPEFANLIREYHDGILVYDISKVEIWDKALKDTAGIEAFFKANKSKYVLAKPKFKGLVVKCINDSVMKSIRKAIAKMDNDEALQYINGLNSDTVKVAEAMSGLWEKGRNGIVDQQAFKDKDATVKEDAKMPVSFIKGKILKKRPEVYTDVRGAVTTDYQNELDAEFIERLRAKYPVNIIK